VRDGNPEIYSMDADGGNQTRLTHDPVLAPAFDVAPAWSPDGSKLAFTSDRNGNSDVYVMAADGGNQTRLTNNPASDSFPAWSPDGSTIAFTSYRDGNGNVYVMDADGGNPTPLTSDASDDFDPAWSPDGAKIAFTSLRDGNHDVYVMDANGGNQTRLTNDPGKDSEPDWQPRDVTAPSVSCDAPDGIWHETDVTLSCAASDGGFGLANPADASFTLSTSVGAGTQTANAFTASHQVCDRSGNCTTAGPIGGNKVDKKAPTIVLSSPVDGSVYLLNQEVAAGYACLDPGSGVASCAAPVPAGASIATGSVGAKSFPVNSIDQVGNVSPTATAGYAVAYGVSLLFDSSKATKTITLELVDANNVDVSAAAILLTVETIDGAPVSGDGFTYVKNGSSYKYTPKKLAAGAHTLTFHAGADPTTHTVVFNT
jgi:WD40-like Beta Propeller Repeat